jgi:prepilin-type N-terminal cleavage/methylation domain-containing protein
MKTITPTQQPASPAFRKNRSSAFTLIELLVVISIIAVLAGIALPVFTAVQIKAHQANDLSNAKQVGLGLRLYASDNSGFFPTSSTTSNAAFQNIVPTYIPTQKIFWLANSIWSTGSHFTEISGTTALQQGQNTYAYVSGLTDSSNTNFPLVADGFVSGTPGTYTTNATVGGGVWKGTKAIVVHVDDSAAIDAVGGGTATNYKVYENGANPLGTDIFATGDTTGVWMGTAAGVLNPQ